MTKRLRGVAKSVRLVEPPSPHNDLRDWVRAGAVKPGVDRSSPASRGNPLSEAAETMHCHVESVGNGRVKLIVSGGKAGLFVDKFDGESDRARQQALQRLRNRGVDDEQLGRIEAEIVACALASDERHDTANESLQLFESIEPWPEAVDCVELLDSIKARLQLHIDFADSAATACALWVAHTYVADVATASPRLAIKSPTKRCGKTRLLTLLSKLVARPRLVSNLTPAALFRSVELWRPTLLIDEADSFLGKSDELRGIINAGYEADGVIVRCIGEDYRPTPFHVFSPLVIASISDLPSTIEDRAVVICMRRKTVSKTVQKMTRRLGNELLSLRQKLLKWSQDMRHQLKPGEAETEAALDDRARDLWDVLFAIADVAGGSWPEAARSAARDLTAGRDDADMGVQLLEDIRAILDAEKLGRISSADLVDKLVKQEERPWATWHRGEPMTQNQLSRRLRGFGVVSKSIRLGSGQSTSKGFVRAQFEDAFERYLPEAAQRHSSDEC